MNFFGFFLVVLGIVAAHANSIDFNRLRRSTLTARLNNGMEQKIRALADGDAQLEDALNEYKKSYVRAFDETLKENFRQVREVLTDRRRSVDTEAAVMSVKRAFDTMEERIHQKAQRDLATRDFASFWNKVKEGAGKVKDWIATKFGTFSDWAKKFLSNVYEDVKPDIEKIRDMAVELIKTQAKDLSEYAKDQAKDFFRENSEALTDKIKEQISNVLS